MAKSKSISLADVVINFQKSASGKKCMAMLEAKRNAHPAKFARQYDLVLTNLSMEMGGRIKTINYLQNILTPAEGYNANDLTQEQTKEIWEHRTKEIYALHSAQVKYDNRKAELDKAVFEYDNK